MLFKYAYAGSSAIDSRTDATHMSFSPDTKRDPTFFQADLQKGLPFREAISALHDVVVSDLRFRPKDREAYKAWLEQQQERELEMLAAENDRVARQIEQDRKELAELDRQSQLRSGPFYKARRRYFDYLYKRDYDAWMVLDPVITVHPDEIFFECFSQDESSYGRLGVDYNVFKNMSDFACGTTNIDYSAGLYNEFQKIRSYKNTHFEVDPSGFEVKTTDDTTLSESFKEVKIDLPESWVRGFLQVSSAMSLDAAKLELHPMDVHNLCFILRRHREIRGPRSMRYILKPGQPVAVVFEPWNHRVECPRSRYLGSAEQEIRVWGRRRLLILERLIPVTKKFTVHLLGTGMPSFYVADLGDMSFTLGLSGWTANDWATAGNFDLMAPRTDVDSATQSSVYAGLRENWLEKPEQLAQRLGLDRSVILGALGAYTQAGRAIYDLNKEVYRVRELSREPLPLDKLRFANEREQGANRFVDGGAVRLGNSHLDANGALHISGSVRDGGRKFLPTLMVDADERLSQAECGCPWHSRNKLYKGPCEHILALRKQFAKQAR